jgi:hypothetical protein
MAKALAATSSAGIDKGEASSSVLQVVSNSGTDRGGRV